MAFGSFAPGASPILDMVRQMQPMMKTPTGPGIFGAQQGMTGLATDKPMNGSGVYTGPANQPGFAPPAPANAPGAVNPAQGGAGGLPGLLQRIWGSMAPGQGAQGAPGMPMNILPPGMGGGQ